MNQKLAKDIGQRISKLRCEREMTADDLAERIEKDRATVYRYESGEIAITVETLLLIAKVLEKPLSYFIEPISLRPEQQMKKLLLQQAIQLAGISSVISRSDEIFRITDQIKDLARIMKDLSCNN